MCPRLILISDGFFVTRLIKDHGSLEPRESFCMECAIRKLHREWLCRLVGCWSPRTLRNNRPHLVVYIATRPNRPKDTTLSCRKESGVMLQCNN